MDIYESITRELVESERRHTPDPDTDMPPGSSKGRVRPSEVAADTKKNFIPLVASRYAAEFPPYSVLYPRPTRDLGVPRRTLSTRPPHFVLESGDPVDRAIYYSVMETQRLQAEASQASSPQASTALQHGGTPRVRVPFISAANERRPGGDWETGSSGYEEKLCRRSNLWATLSTPWPAAAAPGSPAAQHYPIPSQGGILSDSVVVYRGPHEGGYKRLDAWYDVPVVSVPPTRWPKLRQQQAGSASSSTPAAAAASSTPGPLTYSFPQERDMMRDKMRGALLIALHAGYTRAVVGDFGLGNGYRNPPRETAEMWRDLFLFDPDIRGQFQYVVFAFDDAAQSTEALIRDDMAKRESKRAAAAGAGASQHVTLGDSSACPSDMAIFEEVFAPGEVERVLSRPDPRYGLAMITS